MTRARQQHREDAERWFIRLAGEDCTPAERSAFEQWRADPEHASAYVSTERLWNSFDRFVGSEKVEYLTGRVLAEAAVDAQRIKTRWTLALVASVATLLIAAVGYIAFQGYTPTKTYVTDAGQRSTVRLDDGSEVTLNSATRLEVKLSSSRRRFELVRGEAVFAVAEDHRRLFTVIAGDGEVTALATRFQVRNEAKHVVVTLLEGRIALDRDRSRQHLQLEPGEQVRFTTAAPGLSRRIVDPEVVASWTTGRLKFHSTPLGEAVEEMNRYAKTRIRLDDPSLALTPVNGSFEIGDSASLVSALQALLSIQALSQNENEIILKKGSK